MRFSSAVQGWKEARREATFRLVSADRGRIVALVPLGVAGVLRERGWEVDDLDDEAGVARWCTSLPEAKALCERDLPRGTAVNWAQAALIGGFVSGYPGVGPEMGGPMPAFVLWPDGGESHAESVGALTRMMRGRMQWLAQMASTACFEAADISQATSRTLAALDRLEETGVLSYDASGPIHDVRSGAVIVPVAKLRRDGFRDGWRGCASSLDDHPVHGERHPRGAYADVWRGGVTDGIRARAEN
jgi:hypothetical protein